VVLRARQDETVSELDRLKERLAYLRFWLGIVVGGIIVLGIGILILHRKIKRRIRQIRSL
jgi:hypothetical protein